MGYHFVALQSLLMLPLTFRKMFLVFLHNSARPKVYIVNWKEFCLGIPKSMGNHLVNIFFVCVPLWAYRISPKVTLIKLDKGK